MPEYGGVHVKLQSQYENLVIPEYAPLQPSPTLSSPTDELPSEDSTELPDGSIQNVMDVYIPIYFGSQFWIVCDCDEAHDGTRYYYFKLYINDRCLLSWGIGAADRWAGRITHGMYEGPRDFEDKPILEKRGFFFPPSNMVDASTGGFEIQVFRARARKREEAKFEPWVGGADGRGICVNRAGHVKRREPKRRYTYALIDPVDEPLVTFRYHCRTGDQLRGLNISLPVPDFFVEDIMVASPSKRNLIPPSPIVFSPPPKEKPKPPPKNFAGKDSIALRRASMTPKMVPRSPVVQKSPVKKHQDRGSFDIFDALGGLSLSAEPARTIMRSGTARREWDFHLPLAKKKFDKELPGVPPPVPPIPSSTGFFSRLKRRRLGSIGGKEESKLS